MINKLKEQLRLKMLGQLSDEKTVRVGMPFYNNAGIVDRKKSLEKGIEKCIEHFEKRL